jgi:hypothetical protein
MKRLLTNLIPPSMGVFLFAGIMAVATINSQAGPPACGLNCSQTPCVQVDCEDCCDGACPPGGGSTGPRGACYLRCSQNCS